MYGSRGTVRIKKELLSPTVQQFLLGAVEVFKFFFKTSSRIPRMGKQAIARPLQSIQQFILGAATLNPGLLYCTGFLSPC
jgi:hypothetical protein